MKKVEITEPYLIEFNATIYDCLLKFEQNKVHTLLVRNKQKIVGTITDGDIRKVLIKMRTLYTTVNLVMNNDYYYCQNESECEELFSQNDYLLLIPMLNQQRELISIYLRY